MQHKKIVKHDIEGFKSSVVQACGHKDLGIFINDSIIE